MNVLLRTRRALTLMLVVLVGLLGLVTEGLGVAHAATQTVTVCDQAHLNATITAAASGDTVNFSCSGTITLTSTLTISKNLTLDGSGQQVTLDGQNTVRVILVSGTTTSFTLNALTIANGSATSNFGGGLDNEFGTVSITNSTFTNNLAIAGGGVLNRGTMSIINSTFVKNSTSTQGGGAIGNAFNATGSISISNSTIVNNSGMGIFGGGGLATSAVVNIRNSIVANNTSSIPGTANCANVNGTINDQGYNLSNDTSCGFTNSTSQQNIDPMLGPLQNNGGPTQTLALLLGSPANDKIPASLCPSTDQRGFPRPDNGESVCDIGAYEFQDPPAPSPAPAVCEISTTKPGTFCLNENSNFATTDIS